MKNDELNKWIAINVFGWIDVEFYTPSAEFMEEPDKPFWRGHKQKGDLWMQLPDYCTSPAASRELEKKCAEKDSIIVTKSTVTEHEWVVVTSKTRFRECHPTLELCVAKIARRLFTKE